MAEGRLEKGAVSAATVRRLYTDHGLDKAASRDSQGPKTRLSWQAEHPGALWHGDVCHGPGLKLGKETLPLRIHALLDDASRYVVALEAVHQERELDMLRLMEFELDQGFLAGQLITAAWCPLDEPLVPWAELHGKRYPLHPVDPYRQLTP